MPESILIVGAGPIGLACAISARRRGLDPLVIDAGAIADSIVRYPVGLTFFTTPDQGATIKRREDTHRMAEANKAFAHYRW